MLFFNIILVTESSLIGRASITANKEGPSLPPTMCEFGSTVSRLQTNVQGLREETETFQRATAELLEQRNSLQCRVTEADRQLSERRAELSQLLFMLHSQGMMLSDRETRVKEAEQENAAVQAELTQLRDAVAAEKRQRLVQLEATDSRVQGLVLRFRETACLTDSKDMPQQAREAESARNRVENARETTNRLTSRLESDQGLNVLPLKTKTDTLEHVKARVGALKRQLGLQ